MKNIIPILFFFVILIFTGCSPTVSQSIEAGISEEPVYVKDYWNSSQVTLLYEDSAYILGGISDVKFHNGIYVVLNDRNEFLSLFDEKGNNISTFKRLGNAHDEYIRIVDYDIMNDSIYILCAPHKIIVTNMQCKVGRVIDISGNFSRLACNEGLLYVYNQDTRGVYVKKGNSWKELVVEGELPGCPHLNNSVFFKTKNELLFYPEAGEYIYSITKMSAEKWFSFDYPEKDKIIKAVKNKQRLSMKESLLLSPPCIHSIAENKELYIITYTYQGLFRACTINKTDFTLHNDGYWKGKTPIPKYSNKTGLFGSAFISKYDSPLDSLKTKIILNNHLSLEDGKMVLIKYTTNNNE